MELLHRPDEVLVEVEVGSGDRGTGLAEVSATLDGRDHEHAHRRGLQIHPLERHPEPAT